MTRRAPFLALAIALLPAAQAFGDTIPIEVRKTGTCACCVSWMAHLSENGFAPTAQDLSRGQLARFKRDNGVPQGMVSCHTALVGDYVIEGHVPASDIRQLLNERPDAVGLAVPGMPYGSPGMGPQDEREAYDVVLISRDGAAGIFKSYPASD